QEIMTGKIPPVSSLLHRKTISHKHSRLVDVVVLVAYHSQHLDSDTMNSLINPHLRTPTPPGSSIIESGKSIGYLSQRFTNARSKWPWATRTTSQAFSPCILPAWNAWISSMRLSRRSVTC
ncbi:hypothetical protein T310_6623, partial [Rasamsonia emersonii CBS 393.64]